MAGRYVSSVLAQGIETDAHLVRARARGLGATLGQGWLLGRPTGTRCTNHRPTRRLRLPWRVEPRALGMGTGTPGSPFAAPPPGTVLRRSPKRLLVELSKELEREAVRIGETAVVAATFQHAVHFTRSTQSRYRLLVARTGFVCALGEDLPEEPLPGLRGAALDPRDPVRGEWDLVVLGPHFATALLARDLGDDGPEMDRMFEYALTYRRETVVLAAAELLSRVAPRIPST